MDGTIEHIEMTIVDLISEIGATLEQLRAASNADEKATLANIVVQLSSAQKNLADTMEIIEDVDFINYDLDDDDEDFFFHKEPLDLRKDNRIEFNPNNSGGKKKKTKNRKKKESTGDDEDLPF